MANIKSNKPPKDKNETKNMAIVSSSIVARFTLADGRTRIYESHTDSIGTVHFHTFIAEVGENISTALANHASEIATQISNVELIYNYNELIGKRAIGFSVTLNNITATQWRNYVRSKFLNSTEIEACIIARYVLSFTDAQIKNIFNINDVQLATLKVRLADRVTTLTSLESTVGE